MTKTDEKNFLGLPVSGDIRYFTDQPAEQYPLEDLQPFFKAVLDDPEVHSFGWTQYTPYFNDGDACVFHTWGVWVLTQAEAAKMDLDEPDFWYDFDRYEHEIRHYTWRDEAASPQHWIDLSSAVEGGHFNNVLLEAFGDPADIRVTRDGITVSEYEHE